MVKNKNITPLKKSDLKNEISWKNFKYKNYFKLSCVLKPNKSNESLDINVKDPLEFNKNGLIYVFVIDNKILKIGQTIGAINSRIRSYNCGKVEYRINGTASTTNYFILQSILKINEPVLVFTYKPNEPKINVFGKKIKTNRPITKVIENKIIEDFEKQHGKKPIGITQK